MVLSGVSFAVGAGEALLVTGPNGAGKSSLLRLVAGLVRPAAGRLELEGGDRERDARRAGALSRPPGRAQAVADGGGEPRFLGALSRRRRRHDAAATRRSLRSGSAAWPACRRAYLSAGQRRRLSIARLIAVERPLWLLDEPTSALDAAAQAMLADLMRAHLAGGGMILAATHGPIGLDGAKELRLGGRQ